MTTASFTMSNKDRITHMMWSWFTVSLIYGTTRFMPGQRWVIPETWLETQIPFNASGIWFYLAFFLFVPWAFLNAEAGRVIRLRYAIQISAILSGIVFVVFPTTLHYPPLPMDSIHAKLFGFLLMIDTAQNCLPSLHAAMTLLALFNLWDWQKKLQSILYLAIALLIGFSIIQLRRHLLIDVTAGLLAGVIAQLLAQKLLIRISDGAQNHE